MDTLSYWSATHTFPAFPAIERAIEVDVVVVGAGLTGITTAYTDCISRRNLRGGRHLRVR